MRQRPVAVSLEVVEEAARDHARGGAQAREAVVVIARQREEEEPREPEVHADLAAAIRGLRHDSQVRYRSEGTRLVQQDAQQRAGACRLVQPCAILTRARPGYMIGNR